MHTWTYVHVIGVLCVIAFINERMAVDHYQYFYENPYPCQ